MSSIKKIELNKLYESKLVNDDFVHKYSICLEKNSFYYIELLTVDKYEFNLRLYDSKNKEINLNKFHYKDLKNKEEENNFKLSYDYDTNEDEQLTKLILDHNEYIDRNYKEESSDSPDVFKEPSNDMKIVLYDETTKENIEIIIGLSNPKNDDNKMEEEAINYMNAIQNLKRISDYKNKIYFKSPKKDDYILTVNSEYENEEGEYSLIIRQVEDISIGKNLILDEDKDLRFKKKNITEKFSVRLNTDTKYILSSKSVGLNIFIFGEGKTLTNKGDLDIIFKTNLGGIYLIEVMSCKDNHENQIRLEELYEESKEEFYRNDSKINLYEDSKYEINKKLESEFKIYDDYSISRLSDSTFKKENNYFENLILKDIKTEDKYKVYIENGQLKTKKVNH